MATHNGVSGRHPLIEILSAWHRHELLLIPGCWHPRVRPCRSDFGCTLFTARVQAAGRDFRAVLLAPGRNRWSSGVGHANGLGCLVRIGCGCPAALLNPMPFFSLQRSLIFGSFVLRCGYFEFWSSLFLKACSIRGNTGLLGSWSPMGFFPVVFFAWWLHKPHEARGGGLWQCSTAAAWGVAKCRVL